MKRQTTIAVLMLLPMAAVQAGVDLDERERANFAIETTPTVAESRPVAIIATAEVLNAGSLLTSLAQLSAAEATINATRTELDREEALQRNDDNIALRDVEATRARLAADQSAEQVLRAGILQQWGNTLARQPEENLASLASALGAGTSVLVRLSLPEQHDFAGTDVTLEFTDTYQDLQGQMLGPMPLAESNPLGMAWLARVDGPGAVLLQPGRVMTAQLIDAANAIQGIAVPGSAVVRWQGRDWVYTETASNHFERHEVELETGGGDTLLLHGLEEGERVVSVGAGLLLGAELNTEGESGEEDD